MTVSRKVSLHLSRSDLFLSFPKISGRIERDVNSEKDCFVFISISSHLSFSHKVHNLVIQGNYVFIQTFYQVYCTCLHRNTILPILLYLFVFIL